MHLTNLQLVLMLFLASNLTVYLLGRRHGRASERREISAEPAKLALGTMQIRRER